MSGNGNQTNILDQINNTQDRIWELRRTMHNFWNDPGHGWLEVQKSDLMILGISKLITGFSYHDGPTAYLEEDQDAGTYLKALFNNDMTGIEFKTFQSQCFRDRYQENIFIRNLRHYRP
jgi:hypothetical protein